MRSPVRIAAAIEEARTHKLHAAQKPAVLDYVEIPHAPHRGGGPKRGA